MQVSSLLVLRDRCAAVCQVGFLLIATMLSTTSLLAQDETTSLPAWLNDKSTPADLLPDSVALYAEVTSFDTLWNHPLREKLLDSELMKTIMKNPELSKARDGIRLAEVTLGKKLPVLLSEITTGGLTMAVDRANNAAALFIAGEDVDSQQELAKKLMSKAAQLQGREDGELPSADYRGVTAYRLPEGGFALLGKWIVVVNKNEMGKAIIDRYLDGPSSSLSQAETFIAVKTQQTALASSSKGTPLGWMYADVKALREAGVAKEVLDQKPDDFGAELIFGGLFTILRHSPMVAANLSASDDTLALKVATPFDKSWIEEPEEFFFGPDVTGAALPALQLPDTLASLTSYRDISSLWLHAGDLFGEKVNDQLAQAESTLTTLFSGKDFAEDILGAFQPEVRLISTPPQFDKDQPIPSVQVPAFALVAQMREPEKMRKELKRIYQSFIGFINVAGAMNGQPQFDQDMDKVGNADLLIARYAWDDSQPDSKEIPIQYNFTPCLLTMGEYMVLSSTEKLARDLIEPLQKEAEDRTKNAEKPAASSIRNTYLEVSGEGIRQALQQNRDQLITKNMLEKGQTREEAESEFDVLLQILKMTTKLTIDFKVGEEANLDFDLKVGAK